MSKRMTTAEEDAVYLVAFAASCAKRQDWKMLEQEILARLHDAERRGQKQRARA